MKKFTIIILSFFLFLQTIKAQQVNWKALRKDQHHLVHLNLGFDYGTTVGVGYGRHLPGKIPFLVSLDYSSPAGENLVDDFKTRIGAQAEVLRLGDFSATVKAYSIFRRYQNEATRIINFGSEFSAVLGYYQPKWFAGAEFGFDKAITSQVKHSRSLHENYPGIQDGWYLPAGGNFLFGVQGGYSFRSTDINIKAGKLVTQDLKTKPLIPFYVGLSINQRF